MSVVKAKEYFCDMPDGALGDFSLEHYDPNNVPAHIAIIMDGNGRWAKAKGLSRSEGHEAGIEGVRAAIRTCSDLGVRYLTIYSFSTENWRRPQDEVDMLMELFAHTMAAEVDGLNAENVRVLLLGNMDALPSETRESFAEAMDKTKHNTGMTLVMAVNYGGRSEITNATKLICEAALAGELQPSDVDEALVSKHLYTGKLGIPDPDLVIRTSGEFRISNFLLWQIAYSELYVTNVLWPDFDKYELLKAVLSYQSRNRRYGNVQ